MLDSCGSTLVADSKQGNTNIILEPGSQMQNREEKKICQISFYLSIEHFSNLSIFRTNNNNKIKQVAISTYKNI